MVMVITLMLAAWWKYFPIAVAITALIVLFGWKRVRWRWWDLLSFSLPFCLWSLLVALTFPIEYDRPSRFGEFRYDYELLCLSLAVPVAALVRVILGHRVREDTCARRLMMLLCLLAFGLHWLMPRLP